MDSLMPLLGHHGYSDGISETILSQDENPNQASEEASPNIVTDQDLEIMVNFIEEVSPDLLNGPVGDQGLPDTTYNGGHGQEQMSVLEACNQPTYQSSDHVVGGIEEWLDDLQLQSPDSPKETGKDIRSETFQAPYTDFKVDLDAVDDDSQTTEYYQISDFINSDEKTPKTSLGKQVADAVAVSPDPKLEIKKVNIPSHRFRYESELKPADGKRKRNISRDPGSVEVLWTGQIGDLIIQFSLHQKDGQMHPNSFYIHDSSKNVIQVADNIMQFQTQLQISTSDNPENAYHKIMSPAFSIQRAKAENRNEIDTRVVFMRVNIYGNKGHTLVVKDYEIKLECATKRHNRSILKLSPNGCSWDGENEIDLLGDNSDLMSIIFENEPKNGEENFYKKITEFIYRDKNKLVLKAPKYFPSGGSVKVKLEFGNKPHIELKEPFTYTPRKEISTNTKMILKKRILEKDRKYEPLYKRLRLEDSDDI